MKWFESLRREEGFTIQETLVVLIVSSLLVSFGLSLFQFTSEIVSKWGRKNEVHGVVNGVAQRIALDVQRSRSVSEITDSSLVLEYGIGKQVVFRFKSAGAWRDDVEMDGVLQGQLLSHFTIDSTGILNIGVGSAATAFNATTHVSVPWSSRHEFVKSSRDRSAASNRH